MKEVTIIAKNEVGSLAAVAEALGGVGVNIEAISAYGRDNSAIFRIITNDYTTAAKSASKVPGVKSVLEADVIIYKLINRPGELGKITRKLANRGVNLESLYIVSRKQDFTEIAIKPEPSHLSLAKEVLGIR
jgi:hypothetical protein